MYVCMYLFEVFVLVFRMVYQTKPKVGAKAPMQQNNALYTRAYTKKNKYKLTYICKQLRVCTKSSRILCYIIKTRYDWLMGGMWQVAASPSILCASNTFVRNLQPQRGNKKTKKNVYTKTKAKMLLQKQSPAKCVQLFLCCSILLCVAALLCCGRCQLVSLWCIEMFQCCPVAIDTVVIRGFEPRKQTATNASETYWSPYEYK